MAGKGQWLEGYCSWRVIEPAAWKVTQGLNNNSGNFFKASLFVKTSLKNLYFPKRWLVIERRKKERIA